VIFADIINQLKVQMPRYTDLFSENSVISNYVINSNTVTFTVNNHGFQNGDIITVRGATLQNDISSFVVNPNGTITFTTNLRHDMTTNWQEQVEIRGFANYDGFYDIVSLSNDHTYFTIVGTSAPIGTGYILENRIDGINGTYVVSNVTTNTFDVDVSILQTGSYIISNAYVSHNVRVSGITSADRIEQIYNRQDINNWWAFVEMRESSMSYSKQSETQAVQKITNSSDFNGELVIKFSVYVVAPSGESLGVDIVDKIQELRPIMIKSLAGSAFSAGFSDNKGYLSMFTGDSIAGYVGAYYVHSFNFEITSLLGNNDLVDDMETRAFTLIDKTISVNTGNGTKHDIIYLKD